MPSRKEGYYRLLQESQQRGYECYSIRSFWQLIQAGVLQTDRRYLVLRHDIDTDRSGAEAFWQVEQSLNARASFYFRLSTIDIPLMQKIEASGSEASYHYEEIASIAKQLCLHGTQQIAHQMPTIRQRFKSNLTALRQQSGLPMSTMASHGDFVNRKLKIHNYEILKDSELREELTIEAEVYDDAINRPLTSRFSDAPYPRFWQPSDPLEAIRRGDAVVYLLTHPRHWHPNPRGNLADNFRRLAEGLRYSLCGLRNASYQ